MSIWLQYLFRFVPIICSAARPKPTMAPHVPSAKGERKSRVWNPHKWCPDSLWFQNTSIMKSLSLVQLKPVVLLILSGVLTAAWETGSKTFTCTGSSVQFTTCRQQVAKSKTVVFDMAMYSTILHSIAFNEIATSTGRVPRKKFSGFSLDVNG